MCAEMATSVESKTRLNKDDANEVKHISKILKANCEENIIEHIQTLIDKYNAVEPSQKFCKKLKASLDKNFKKEWNVFMGGHFCGACGVVAGGYVELMINNSLKVVVFQSYSAS